MSSCWNYSGSIAGTDEKDPITHYLFLHLIFTFHLILIIGFGVAMAVIVAVISIFRKLPKANTVAGELLTAEQAPAMWSRIRTMAEQMGIAPPNLLLNDLVFSRDVWYNTAIEDDYIMIIVQQTINLDELNGLSQHSFNHLVKAVLDIEQEILVVDAELHADEEELLLEQGSKQEDLWGINLYPTLPDEHFIEFDSMINLRPSFGNSSRGVDDPRIRERITQIIHRMVIR